jgi:hypothetical protein
MSAAIRCPHCKAELPEKASFCANCGRRIEGWSLPKDATPASGSASLPGGEEATRQMSPTPSLLRAAALSVKKGGAKSTPRKQRSFVPLIIGMIVVAVAGGFAAFFFVRRHFHKTPKPAIALSAPVPVPVPVPAPVPVPVPASVAAPAPPKPIATTGVRKSKTGKRAHVIASAPVPVKAPKQPSSGGLPRKQVATDSKPLALPTAQHETTEAPSTTPAPIAADDKQEAQATLDADSVRFVVRQHLPQVRACYGRAFKDSSPGGAVEIGFAIDPTGRAKNVRTETNTTDSEGLAHCLESRVKEWQFPRPVGGDYELIYPFVFAPGS